MVTRTARHVALCSLAVALLSGCGGGGGAETPNPSPTRSAELPSPTQTAEQPSPTRTLEKPSPTRTVEKPSPTRTAEQPSPTKTAEQPSPTPSPAPTQSPQPTSPVRTQTTTVTATPAESTAPSGGSSTEQQGAAQPTETPTAAPTDQGDQGDQPPAWVWWLLAALILAALAGVITALVLRRRRQRWLADLGAVEAELVWFARTLLPELRRSTTLDQVVGAWKIGAPRVAAAEDQLTLLEASAPGEADGSRARTLRDAARLAHQRLDTLTAATPHETWALDLDEVAADLEVALGPPTSATPPSD